MFGKIKEEYLTLSYDGGRRREGEERTSVWSLVLQVKNRSEDKGLLFTVLSGSHCLPSSLFISISVLLRNCRRRWGVKCLNNP